MSSRVLVSIRVKATPRRAFDAFAGEIGQWWRPNEMFQFTPRAPGVLSFEPGPTGRLIETREGGKVFEVGKVIAWEPGERLAFGWRTSGFAPDQTTEVEVRFEAVGEETRVTVEHRGWDAIPIESIARHGFPNLVFLRQEGEWWQDLLASYRAAAEAGS